MRVRLNPIVLLALTAGLVWLAAPSAALADTPPLSIDTCAPIPPFAEWEYTSRVVYCIKSSVISAVDTFIFFLVLYLGNTLVVMFIMAVIAFGFVVVSGERQLTRRVIAFLLRFGLVLMFAQTMPAWTQSIFAIQDQLVSIAMGSYDPWQDIDQFIGKFFGFGQNVALYQGLLGLIGASVFSSTLGIVLFLAGLMAIIDMILFIFSTVFTYLISVIVIAFLLILSPFIIPLALFFWTERYFRKWLHILFAAMLTPVLLFPFLQLAMGIFGVLLADIFQILGFNCPDCTSGDPLNCTLSTCEVPDLRAYWKLNQPAASWLSQTDPASAQNLQNVTGAQELSIPGVQSNVNPLMRRSLQMSALFPAVNFGPNGPSLIQQLAFGFISLWIFASLAKSLVRKIPEVADNIAAAVSGITVPTLSAQRMSSEFKQNLGIGAATAAPAIANTVARATFGGGK